MQRDVGIARRHEVAHLMGVPVAIVKVDACGSRQLVQLGVSVRIRIGIHRLQDETDVMAPLECPTKRFDRGVRVLSWQMAVDVEDEREDELTLLGAQALTTASARGARQADHRRDTHDRQRRDRCERRGDERCADPDFVVIGETVVPRVGEPRQFPGPGTDVVVPLEERLADV
jgi:hypothetical protein